MIICPRCGYQAPDGSPYCPRCGYGRQQAPVQQPVQQSAPTSKSKPSSLLITALVFAIVICIALFITLLDEWDRDELLQSTVAALSQTNQSLRQTITAFPVEPTSTPTITPTPKAQVPALCKDKQMNLIRLATVLDADGHPYPADYDPDENICLYRLSDSDSFLGMASFGFFSILHDPNDVPYAVVVSIDYKDSAQIQELIRDWGAIAISYIDPDTNPLAASAVIDSFMKTGMELNDKYSVIGGLDTTDMVYQIAVMDNSAFPE